MARRFAPMGFMLVLTLLPIAGLQVGHRQTVELALERETQRWDQRAANLIEDLRAGIDFESQLARMGERLVRSFGRLPSGTGRLSGRGLLRGFARAFPTSHRPPGTLLYGFAGVEGSTGRLAPLSVAGLATRSARLLANLIGRLAEPESVTGGERDALDRRCAGLFGEDVTFETLAGVMRGRPVFGRWGGRPAWILWNRLDAGGRLLGAWLAILPGSAETTARPVRYALRRALRQGDGQVPVLVPIEGFAEHRPVVPPEFRPPPGFAALLAQARSMTGREDRLPVGQRSEHFAGFWVIRDFLSHDLPHELWLVSPRPTTSAGSGADATGVTGAGGVAPKVLLALMLWGVGWTGVLARVIVSGQPPAISLRLQLTACFVVLAALALAGLHYFGTWYLEAAALRRIRERTQLFQERLEQVDAGAIAIQQHFTRICRDLFFDHRLVGQVLASDTALASAAKQAVVERIASWAGAAARAALVEYNLRQPAISTWPPFSREQARFRAFMNLVGVFLDAGIRGVEPELADLGDTLFATREGRTLAVALRSSLDPHTFVNFRNMRQKTDLFRSGPQPLLQWYDFIAVGGRLAGVALAIIEATPAHLGYLAEAVHGLTVTFADADFAYGENTSAGYRPLYPRAGRFWRSGRGRQLAALMGLAVRTGTTRIGGDETAAFLAVPTRHVGGAVLGVVVPFDDIRGDARWQSFALGALLAGLLVLIATFGVVIADDLLVPLSGVESGLLRVAAGDLEVQVGLVRHDELADLTRAFDDMIRGFRERRALGRFVSADLDAGVGRLDAAGERVEIRPGAVLVADLRSFTTLAETHPPREIVRMLNDHHQAMAGAIMAGGGRVEQFIGDAIVGVFFAADLAGSIAAAVAAGRQMRLRHRELQIARQRQGRFGYGMGVGIDAGPLLAGVLGRGGRRDYAVIGQARVSAERLEALSKLGCHSRIILSPEAAAMVPTDRWVPLAGQAAVELAEDL